jgi:hypothetical protein
MEQINSSPHVKRVVSIVRQEEGVVNPGMRSQTVPAEMHGRTYVKCLTVSAIAAIMITEQIDSLYSR